MCGIIGIYGNRQEKAGEIVLEGLKKLEYRGYDSWGICIKDENGLKIKKDIGQIGKVELNFTKSKFGIGHTRWATHGGVSQKNSHPHLDCTEQIAVVHNGILENYKRLKEKLVKKGHKFVSETDTEVIAHLIEVFLKTMNFVESCKKTFGMMKGMNAVLVFNNKNNQMACFRNGSPLVIGLGEEGFFVASDVLAFLTFTKKVIYLEDGDIAILNKKLIIKDKNNREVERKVEEVNWNQEEGKKNGYEHFLLKEIYEQKETIFWTFEQNRENLEMLVEKERKGKKLILLGCGSAYHCCLITKYFLAKKGIEIEAYQANEFGDFEKFVNKNTVVIAVSQSGETIDTLISAKTAKENGAYLVSLVNTFGSSLERISDLVLRVGAGPEIAVVSTKAFLGQLMNLYVFAEIFEKDYFQIKKDLRKFEKVLKIFLSKDLEGKIKKLAEKLDGENDIFVIGKNINYPVGLEFGLKLKETSYVHAEAFASGELKHGVISLVEKNTPCVVLGIEDEYKDDILSSAIEIKARGGRIIGITSFSSSDFDEIIQVPDLGLLSIFPIIIVGQILGYYLALFKNLDPDKPRNLAKSVTVK